MESPDKIYLQVEDSKTVIKQTTWCQDKVNRHDIEYIRADIVKQQIEAAYNLGDKEAEERVRLEIQ